MPILAADIQYRLSGGAANSNANASLGGAISSTAVPSALFDNVSSADATAGLVEYRCIYVRNNHGSLSMLDPCRLFVQANTPSATTTLAIGLGTSAQGGTEQTIANEGTAPIGVSFSEPADFANGVSLGTIPAGGHRAVWLRRTITAGTSAVNDTYNLRTTCDTNP